MLAFFVCLQNGSGIHRHNMSSKIYHCSEPGCSLTFTKPSRLVVHFRTHTGNVSNKNDLFKYFVYLHCDLVLYYIIAPTHSTLYSLGRNQHNGPQRDYIVSIENIIQQVLNFTYLPLQMCEEGKFKTSLKVKD